MKLLLSVFIMLALLGTVVVGASYYAGKYVEDNVFEQQFIKPIEAEIATLESQIGDVVTLDKKYERDWFSSKVILSVYSNDPTHLGGDGKPMALNIIANADHGPVIMNDNGVSFGLFAFQGKLEFPPELKMMMDSLIGSDDLITFNGKLGYNRQLNIDFNIRAIDVSIPQIDVTIKSEPLFAHFNVPLEEGMIEVAMQWPGMAIEGTDEQGKYGKVNIVNLQFNQVMQKLTQKIWVGDFALNIDAFDSNIDNELNVKLNNFSVTGDSSTDENQALLYSKAKMTIGESTVDQVTFGPGEFSLEMNNIDVQVLDKLVLLMERAQHQMQTIEGESGYEKMFAEVEAIKKEAMTLIPQLLEAKPGMKIPTLSLPTSEGHLQGNAALSINSFDPAAMNNPMALLTSIEANVQLQVPVNLVVGTSGETELQAYVNQGYVILEDNMYKIDANLNKGELLVNGKPMPLIPPSSTSVESATTDVAP